MATSVPYDTMSTTSQSQSVFTKCCCCIPLRIGCFILGYLNLIFNSFHTLSLLSFTVYIGISTHWFDHFDYDRPHVFADRSTGIESVERPLLNHVAILLMVVLCVNVAWLAVNVACLVGLHKKRPGPIKMYVAFATARLFLMLAGLVYLVTPANISIQAIVSYSVDLGLTAYFTLVYYIHAMQLEREKIKNQETPVINPNDVAFIYPSKIEKQILVA